MARDKARAEITANVVGRGIVAGGAEGDRVTSKAAVIVRTGTATMAEI